jgi:hypothetical protein
MRLQCKFDPINQLILLSVIPLSGAHCIYFESVGNRLLLSLSLCPKVIILSGFICTILFLRLLLSFALNLMFNANCILSIVIPLISAHCVRCFLFLFVKPSNYFLKRKIFYVGKTVGIT